MANYYTDNKDTSKFQSNDSVRTSKEDLDLFCKTISSNSSQSIYLSIEEVKRQKASLMKKEMERQRLEDLEKQKQATAQVGSGHGFLLVGRDQGACKRSRFCVWPSKR